VNIEPADGKAFETVELRSSWPDTRATPHCTVHGAMNKTYRFENGGGFWNCTQITERGEGHQEIIATCDTGCKQVICSG